MSKILIFLSYLHKKPTVICSRINYVNACCFVQICKIWDNLSSKLYIIIHLEFIALQNVPLQNFSQKKNMLWKVEFRVCTEISESPKFRERCLILQISLIIDLKCERQFKNLKLQKILRIFCEIYRNFAKRYFPKLTAISRNTPNRNWPKFREICWISSIIELK